MASTHSPEQIVQHQLMQVGKLEEILLAEKEILQQQSPDQLIEITKQKGDLLHNIEAVDKQLQNNSEFIQQKEHATITQLLSEIDTTLERCKELNQVNGLIIQHSSIAVERMKSALLENRSKSSMTYNNKGKKSGGLSGKSIKA